MPCRKLELPKRPPGISNSIDLLKFLLLPTRPGALSLTEHENRPHFLYQIWSKSSIITFSINPAVATVGNNSLSHKGYQSVYLFIPVSYVKILKGFMRSVGSFYNLPLSKPSYLFIYVCVYTKTYSIVSYLVSPLRNFQPLTLLVL